MKRPRPKSCGKGKSRASVGSRVSFSSSVDVRALPPVDPPSPVPASGGISSISEIAMEASDSVQRLRRRLGGGQDYDDNVSNDSEGDGDDRGSVDSDEEVSRGPAIRSPGGAAEGEELAAADQSLFGTDDAGYVVEPFHLDEERYGGGGYFDAGGSYVFRKEKEEEDAWLRDVDETYGPTDGNDGDDSADNDEEGDDELGMSLALSMPTGPSRDGVYSELRGLLGEGETVVRALRRYGNLAKSASKKGKRNKREEDLHMDNSSAAASAKENFTRLSELVNLLVVDLGDVDVYQKKREDLQGKSTARASSSSGLEEDRYFRDTTEKNSEMKSEEKPADNIEERWEYRGEDGNVHGPFKTSQMAHWRSAGYFVGTQAVDVRVICTHPADKGEEKEVQMDDLLGDLMDSDDDGADGGVVSSGTRKGKGGGGSAKVKGWLRSDEVEFKPCI